MNDRSYLKKFLKFINEMPKLEKYDSTKRVYILVIELLLHDAYIFDEEESEELSEADILVKVWGQLLLEMVFRGSGVILHWGDAVANNCKQEGKRIKLDLRIIAGSLTNQNLLPDTSVSELAPRVLRNKHYKDKLKTDLCCKMNLDDRITDSANLNINRGSFKLPHIVVVMGMEAVVYTMEIEASGLYLINEIQNLNFPMSVTEVKNGAIETLMNGLSNFKKMATDLKKDNNEILEAKKSKKRKTMKKFTSSNQNVSTSDASKIDWLRPIWFPPTYNLSDSESENG